MADAARNIELNSKKSSALRWEAESLTLLAGKSEKPLTLNEKMI
jgi:hypothetical protein